MIKKLLLIREMEEVEETINKIGGLTRKTKDLEERISDHQSR